MNSIETIDATGTETRRPRTPRWVYLLVALMIASVVGTLAIAHTGAKNKSATDNAILTVKNRVIGCTTLLEQGLPVKDLPDLCTNPEIRQYYNPEAVKPALAKLVLIQLAFDCDQYRVEKITPMPPVCANIPSLASLTTAP